MAKSSKNIPMLPPGKYGELTAYVRNGKIIYRKGKNEKRNPSKSAPQSASRMRWNNVQHLWATFPENWHPGYQNRAAGVTDYNAFMSHNLHVTPIYFTKEEHSRLASVLVPLEVSQGGLREIAVSHDGTRLVSDIAVGSFAITPRTTFGDFSNAVVDNNRDFCQGDSITFIVGTQHFDAGAQVPRVSFECHTVQLDLTSKRSFHGMVANMQGFDIHDGVLVGNVTTGAAVWVRSRVTSDGEVQYSTQRLWCDNAELIARYTSPEALARAAQAYGVAQLGALTPDPTKSETAGKL